MTARLLQACSSRLESFQNSYIWVTNGNSPVVGVCSQGTWGEAKLDLPKGCTNINNVFKHIESLGVRPWDGVINAGPLVGCFSAYLICVSLSMALQRFWSKSVLIYDCHCILSVYLQEAPSSDTDPPSAHHHRSKGLQTLPVLGLQVYCTPLLPRSLFHHTTSLPLHLTNTVPIPPSILL